MTSGAKSNLMRRLPGFTRIYTLESVLKQQEKFKHINTLRVDESTMMDLIDLQFLIIKSNNVIFSGDDSQIGMLDTSLMGGIRYNIPITQYLKDNQVVKLTTITRFGSPLFN